MEATRRGGGDAINEAVDQCAGFVFLSEAKREATDGLSDIEGLNVVVVVTGDGQAFVDEVTGSLIEDFPDGVALPGRTEGQ